VFRRALLISVVALAAGCADRPECEVSGDCPEGHACMSGRCKSFSGHGVDDWDGGGTVRPEDGGEAPPPFLDTGPPPRDTRPPPPRDTRPPPPRDTGPPPPPDTGPPEDTGRDVGPADAAPDVAEDAAPDVAEDAGRDLGVDAAEDGGGADVDDGGGADADAADAGPACELTCVSAEDWSLSCEEGDRINECMMPERDDEDRVIRHTCRVTYVESGRVYLVERTFRYEGEEQHGSLTVVGVGVCVF